MNHCTDAEIEAWRIVTEAKLRECVQLENGDEIWENWVANQTKTVRGWKLDLQGCDLRGLRLCDFDLIGADLRGADLRDCDLKGTWFIQARLEGANFSGTDMFQAHLDFAVIDGANFTGARMPWSYGRTHVDWLPD